MKYLVTGAAGFIGSALARRLISGGGTVVTIDNLSTGSRVNVPEGCIFIEGNTYDPSTLQQAETGGPYDAIIHIAGQSSGEVSFDDPVYDLQTNAQSTLMLLDMAKRTACRKFIYASSMSVYGDHTPALVNEESKTNPKSFYAVGKQASENYMRIYAAQFGLACTALRFFNVYGVGQNMKNLRQGMASIFLAQAIRDHHIVVKGAKERFRDFVYIDDVVDAVLMALPRADGYAVYNVANKKAITVEQVIDTICRKLPFDVLVEYTNGTPGDQFGIYGDNAKIQKELGWAPKVDWEDGMSEMIKWAVSRSKKQD